MNTPMTDRSSLLPRSVAREFAARFFDRKETFLAVAERFGSPLYLLDTRVLAERARTFQSTFRARLPKTDFFYAMKSNNLPLVSQTLVANGFGLDVSSGLELSCALNTAARQIIFSGPGKTDAELELAAAHPHRVTLLLDSWGECRRLSAILDRIKQPMGVGIRLNNNPEGLWRKFGVLPEDLPALYEGIRRHPYLRFKGLQFHSSWNLNPDRQTAFLHELANLLADMPGGFLEALSFLDIGGGYWPPMGEWLLTDTPRQYTRHPAASLDVFADELASVIRTKILPLADCRICFEPGRWICNDAMHILVRVQDRKAPDLVITDAGTNAVGWERFETDYFPVLNLTRPALTERDCHILGSLCTPHDVWGYAYFGKDIREDDILMIPTQGAYTYSLRQAFIKPLPRVAILDGDREPYLLDKDMNHFFTCPEKETDMNVDFCPECGALLYAGTCRHCNYNPDFGRELVLDENFLAGIETLELEEDATET